MRNPTAIAAAALFLASAGVFAQQAAPAAAGATPYVPVSAKLNRVQVDGLLAYPDQVLIVDVRRPDEITTIGGFPTYFSLQPKDVDSAIAFIPRNRTLITVSNHAGRALRVADALLAKGFKVAGATGAQDYEAEGGKLTRLTPPPPAAPKVASVASAAQ